MSRARLTVVEPALFHRDVFEMAAPIQSPAKCEVRSVIRFLKAKFERPVLKFLMCYAQEGDEFLDSIVTGDEIWVFHHILESKQQSKQWRHTHSPRHSHLEGLGVGAAISNTSHSNKAGSTTVKRARLTGKGSRSTALLLQ